MGQHSGIFNSAALPPISMFFAERRGRCEDQEVGRLVVHLRRTLIVESTIIRLLKVPELRAKTIGPRSNSHISSRAKRPTFFLVFATINQLAARNPSFALALAFRSPLSNDGEHHTGDMARQDSAREHDASSQIEPVLGRPRYEYWRSSTVSRVPMA